LAALTQGVEHRHAADEDRPVDAVVTPQPELELERPTRGHGGLMLAADPLAIVRVDRLVPPVAAGVAGPRSAGEAGHPGAAVDTAAIGVAGPHHLRARLHQRAVALLAQLRRLLGASVIG